MINREILLTTQPSVTPIFTNDMNVFESKNGDLFFYGGVYQNNVNTIVYHFIKSENRFVSYPEIAEISLKQALYTLDNNIHIISDSKRYMLKNGEWVYTGTTGIDNPKTVSRDGNVYIVDDHKLYHVSENNSFNKVCEDKRINPRRMVTSDNNIYFTDGYIDLETMTFNTHHLNVSKGNVIYNDVVIDDHELIHVTHDGSIIKAYGDTIYYKYGLNDSFHALDHSNYNELYAITSIVDLIDDNLYLTKSYNAHNSIIKVNVRSLSKNTCLSLRVENNSYSKRVKYNHAYPYAMVLESPLLLGNGGFYKDTSEFDNSLYYDDYIVQNSDNIQHPIYVKYNNKVGIVIDNEGGAGIKLINDDSTNDEFITLPEYISGYNVIHNGRDFIYYNDNEIIIPNKKPLHSLDVKTERIGVSPYYHYMLVKNHNGKYDLIKRANYSGNHTYYTLNMDIDTCVDMKVFNDRVYLLYVSSNDTVLEKVTLNG